LLLVACWRYSSFSSYYIAVESFIEPELCSLLLPNKEVMNAYSIPLMPTWPLLVELIRKINYFLLSIPLTASSLGFCEFPTTNIAANAYKVLATHFKHINRILSAAGPG
jgi:hypothetical protein